MLQEDFRHSPVWQVTNLSTGSALRKSGLISLRKNLRKHHRFFAYCCAMPTHSNASRPRKSTKPGISLKPSRKPRRHVGLVVYQRLSATLVFAVAITDMPSSIECDRELVRRTIAACLYAGGIPFFAKSEAKCFPFYIAY